MSDENKLDARCAAPHALSTGISKTNYVHGSRLFFTRAYMLLLLVLLLALCDARTWNVASSFEVLDALTASAAGDTIELAPGDYIFSAADGGGGGGAPLKIDKSLTFRSRLPHERATLRAEDSSFLFAVTASEVTIADLIIGRQTLGGDERSIDIFVGAGTQMQPATTRHAYHVGADAARALPSRAEIIDARSIYGSENAARKRDAAPSSFTSPDLASRETTLRSLHDIVVRNVDFTKSRSGTNVAFARGAYASVEITRCAFGRAGAVYINALVAAADARFVDFAMRYNTFLDTEVLMGGTTVDAHAFDTNFWQPAQNIFIGGARASVDTYCVDALCSSLGPVVDLDRPESVFASLRAAEAAGATRIRVVRDVELDEPFIITRAGTTLEGGDGCTGAPLISVKRGGGIVSFNGALAGVRNLRFSLTDEQSVALVFTDGVAQTLDAGGAKFAESMLTETNGAVDNNPGGGSKSSAIVMFDGVSFLGTDAPHQVGILINSPRVRVELEDTLVAQVCHAVVAHRGFVVTSSATFFGASGAAIYLETSTRQAGARITDSTFVDCAAPIQLGARGSAANLLEFRVSCCQFLFNRQFSPIDSKDCAKLPALCASALTYNTIITDFDDAAALSPNVPIPESVRAERRMLRSGMNHIEAGRKRDEHAYFGSANEFSLRDSQGRLSRVTGVVNGGDKERAFLLATYAPLRAECTPLDASMFGPTASIVSSVLEVRSDALLHECATLSASFTVANDTLMPSLGELAIYGVTHLGSSPAWDRKHTRVHSLVDETTGAVDVASAVVETSFTLHDADDSHDHRIVVVSHAPLPEGVAAAAAAAIGSASRGSKTTLADHTSPIVARSLCVACGAGVSIPAYLIDAHCGGSSENIRSDFDAAYAELGFGASTAPRHDAVSMFIYGSCETRRCTVLIDQNEIVEGASMLVRGALRRAKALTCADDEPLVQFTDRSSKSALRYMSIEAAASDMHGACAIVVAGSGGEAANGGPSISYSSINGALCVDTRAGGRYIGNDIVSEFVAVMFDFKSAPLKKHGEQPLIFEGNHISMGSVHITGVPVEPTPSEAQASARWQVHADRNTFAAGTSPEVGFSSSGHWLAVAISNTKQVGLLENDDSATSRFLATQVDLAPGAILNLHNQASVSFTAAFIAQNVSALLEDSVHLSDIAFDTASSVTIVPNASVVLRQVLFEDVAASLRTLSAQAACGDREKSTAGIDALRSSIFNGDGIRIFTQAQVSGVAASGSAQYFALDGTVAECADGEARVRTDDVCECPSVLAAAAAEEAARALEAEATPESTTTATTLTVEETSSTSMRTRVRTTTTAKPPRTPKPKKIKSVRVAAIPNQVVQHVPVEQEVLLVVEEEEEKQQVHKKSNNVALQERDSDEPNLDLQSSSEQSNGRRGFSLFFIILAIFVVVVLIILGVICCVRTGNIVTETSTLTATKMGQRASSRPTEQPSALKQQQGNARGNNNNSSASASSHGTNNLAMHLDAFQVDAHSPVVMTSSSSSSGSESGNARGIGKPTKRAPKKTAVAEQ